MVETATELGLRTKEMAYMCIHSNGTPIGQYLMREQHRSGEGSGARESKVSGQESEICTQVLL